MTNVTGSTESIVGGWNKQGSLRPRNNNLEIRNVLYKHRMGKARKMTEPPANTVATNQADTNADKC